MAKAKSAMAHPLYLTADERKLFDALPEKLKEGWEVREERGEYEDSDMKRMLRLSFVRLKDPKLKQLQAKLKNVKDENELAELGRSADFFSAPEEDLAELFFAMGAMDMARLLRMKMSSAGTDADLDGIAALSGIRHAFYESVPD